MSSSSLDAFFSPRAIAVVGASATPGKIGAVPLQYLAAQGYRGELYPVNPARQEILGLRAHARLADIGRPVDLAILAVPAAQVDAALDDAVAAGVKHLVIFTAGFAEAGPDGEAAQQRLAAKARQAGIRVLGPNCLGYMNAAAGIHATFSPVVAGGLVPAGPVGIVSQSGAFAAYAYGLARERGLGLSTWVATGNEVDIDVADCIAWMARDPATRIILAYMEGCRDGVRLKQALAAAHAAGKPVVMVKVGRTDVGAQAAASHTASLAGDDAAYDALFRQYGAWRARSVEELFDVAHALAVAGEPANRRVGLLTVSGGVGALMADDAAEAGLEVAPLPQAARQRIQARVPLAATRNPVDVTGQVTVDAGVLKLAARTMLEDGGYGSLVIFLAAAGLTPALQSVQRELAAELRRDFPQCLVAFSTLPDARLQADLEALGCLSFADPGRAIRVLAALAFLAAQRGRQVPPAAAAAPAPGRLTLRPGACNEADAAALLQAQGVPVLPLRRARTQAEAVEAASALGYPVVMKVLSADIVHKSDVGGVVLDIADAAQAAMAYDTLLAGVRARAPQAVIEGVLVAPMVRGGVECIVGVRRDPVLGPVVMLGLGGIHAEVLKDVSLRIAPVDRAQAREMIGELRGAPLLQGHRGTPPADIEALAGTLVCLSDMALVAGDSLSSIELNPLRVMPAGQGVVALDAVVIGRLPVPGGDELAAGVVQAMPLFEMARMRAANTARRHPQAGFAGDGPASTMRWVNQFTHTRRLIGPEDREVVTPNHDTLFTNAWLDLSDGPLVIEVPAMGDRYWVLGFLDAWTNPWACAGRRTTGGEAQRLFVHGPGWQGEVPPGMHVVSAPGLDVWVIGRILVDPDAQDLARVHALQDRFTIRRPDGSPALRRVDALLDGRAEGPPRAETWRRVLAHMLARNPSRHPLAPWPADDDALETALAQCYRVLREADTRAELGGGWTTAVRVRDDFGDDFLTRARVARNWIGTLGIEEAMYIVAEVDADGQVLDGRHRYRLRFPGDAPLEVDAFWSLTLYRRADCLLAPNPIGRHAIGDRTRGLVRDPDGGLSITIQAGPPGPGHNWLPAPAGEGFYLVLRLYQPRPVHLEGRFRYPPVERVG